MTMIGPLRIALAAAALALLSGCAGLGLEDAKMTAPQGNAHDGALQAGYLELAQAEYDEGDYRDSDTFAERSIRAAGGDRGGHRGDARPVGAVHRRGQGARTAGDRKSTRLNSRHSFASRIPSSACKTKQKSRHLT